MPMYYSSVFVDEAAFKNEFKALLNKHGLNLFQDDGMWSFRSPYYDLLAFFAYPKNSSLQNLPEKQIIAIEEVI